MAKKVKRGPNDGLIAPGKTSTLDVIKRADEKVGRTLSRATLDPQNRNASLAMSFGSQVFSDQMKPELTESSAALGEEIQLAMKGDLSIASRIYTSHAISLDTLFTEMARRAAANMGEHPLAFERYMKLALKAQSACRTTLEALARLHQPREQIVKHVHVSNGGQALVTDAIHQHIGGTQNANFIEQSHTTATDGTGTALPSPNPFGEGVSITSREGQTAMQDARRHKFGRT